MIGDFFLGGPMSKKIVLETGRVSWVEIVVGFVTTVH